jgi:hypothetical protein
MKSLKMLIIGLVVLAGLRMVFALWEWSEKRSTLPKAAQARKIERTGKAFIEISPEARVRLLEKLKKIKPGHHIEEAIEELGRPTPPPAKDEKKSTTKPSDEIHLRGATTVVSYYIRKLNEDSFDEEFDEHIHIFTDADGYIMQIYHKEKGKPFVPPPVPGVRKPVEGEKQPAGDAKKPGEAKPKQPPPAGKTNKARPK